MFITATKKSPEELNAFLNGSRGPAGYFRDVSGSQLKITFDVFPWMVSDNMTYLRDKEPNYYFFNTQLGDWSVDKVIHAKDVLRSAVADFGVDLTSYDADNNKVLEGLVVVYEGKSGMLAGSNMSWTNNTYNSKFRRPNLDNVATLDDSTDPNFRAFKSQHILFRRYNNIPEQWSENYPGKLIHAGTWAHEIGHLLLGYRNYYYNPGDLGDYAFSAHSGDPNPFHPAALEKWLFVHWIEQKTIESSSAFQSGDVYVYSSNTFHVKISNISAPDYQVSFTLNKSTLY
ncbi:MAG: hypothetical protein MRK02_06080 [Candidatus Scalindua sp.]|nr:hypothetical protein [Candidatus Scalindua sp.]